MRYIIAEHKCPKGMGYDIRLYYDKKSKQFRSPFTKKIKGAFLFEKNARKVFDEINSKMFLRRDGYCVENYQYKYQHWKIMVVKIDRSENQHMIIKKDFKRDVTLLPDSDNHTSEAER